MMVVERHFISTTMDVILQLAIDRLKTLMGLFFVGGKLKISIVYESITGKGLNGGFSGNVESMLSQTK